MKIRLILLTIVGVAAYVVLANFHGKMIKEAAVSRDHAQTSAPQQPAAQSPAVSPPPAAAPVTQPETTAPAQVEPAPITVSDPVQSPVESSLPRKVEPPQIQLATEVPAATGEQLRKLYEEMAQKDQQIHQLLGTQEAIADKYRTLLAETEAKTAGFDAKNNLLDEHADRIRTLTAERDNTAAELGQAKTALEQLRREIVQKQAAAEAQHAMLKEHTDRITTLNADKDKTAAELAQTKTELEQLRLQVEQMQVAGKQAEAFVKEKETLLNTAQLQVQERTGESNQLKTQVAETSDKLAAAKAQLEQAERKAEAMARLNSEKEQQASALNEQKTAVERALQEKSESLNKAMLAIQSLKQEVSAQPQAVATVQHLLDERTKEFEQIKKEAAARIEQLSKQVTDLGKNDDLAVKERDQCKAEIEIARKKVAALESAQTTAQGALTEVEQKLAAALEHKNGIQAQLTDKEAALGTVQAHITELTAKITALSNEKLGLSSQLEALQADHNSMLTMKNTYEDQVAALARAEGKLKEMAALQAKNEEMNKTLAEKNAALDKAARQGEELALLKTELTEAAKQIEASVAAAKQLEADKASLAGQLASAQTQVQHIDGLKKSLEEKSNALTSAENKIKELAGAREQIAALETKVTEAQTTRQTAEKKAGEAETASKKCSEALTASSGKVKALEGELATAQARIKELTDKNLVQAQQDLVPNLNQQIATLRDQIAQMETGSNQAKKGLTDAMAAVQVKTEEALGAVARAQALQAEKDQLQQAVTAGQSTIDDLQKQLTLAKAFQAAAPATVAPTAPANKPVTDADHDGIADGIDLCPGSPAGAPVNSLGCPAQKGIVLEGVGFKTGTAVLTPESQKKLDQTAAVLVQARTKVEVAGYTDNVGDPKRNQSLSAQRAQAVVAYLAGKNVTAAQLTAKGYGPDNPIGDNTTQEGRQKNRRIELHVMAP